MQKMAFLAEDGASLCLPQLSAISEKACANSATVVAADPKAAGASSHEPHLQTPSDEVSQEVSLSRNAQPLAVEATCTLRGLAQALLLPLPVVGPLSCLGLGAALVVQTCRRKKKEAFAEVVEEGAALVVKKPQPAAV